MKTSSHFLVAARQHEIAALEQLGSACTWVASVSALVHALQKERGLSNMFLASSGARGCDFLQAQRVQVDSCITAFGNTLEQAGPLQSAGHGARLCNAIAYALQGLEALPQLRAMVLAQRITPTESTRHYIRLVTACLSIVFEAADSANEPALSRSLVAMFHFMQGKEFAGQERAIGTAVFSAGGRNTDYQTQWLELIDAQERCLQVFADLGSDAVRTLWQAQSHDNADLASLERLRRVGNTVVAGASLDAGFSETWFAVCTHRLDAMHIVELALAQELRSLCAQKLEAARHTLQTQQPTLQSEHGADKGSAPQADMHFFAHQGEPFSWPLEAACVPPAGRAVLLMVHEQGQRLQAMQAEMQQAKRALHERKTVERAKGVLMQYQRMGESDAHKFLRQTAMNQNKRMLEVAEAVLAMAAVLPPSSGA